MLPGASSPAARPLLVAVRSSSESMFSERVLRGGGGGGAAMELVLATELGRPGGGGGGGTMRTVPNSLALEVAREMLTLEVRGGGGGGMLNSWVERDCRRWMSCSTAEATEAREEGSSSWL